VLLPIAVAAILVIVQDSLAVAFSLAGIAGLLRFRNALDDTRDAMYVVIAIAVGLGAGVGTLEASAALSGVYNLAVVAESTAPAGKREGMLRVHAADDIPTRRLIEEVLNSHAKRTAPDALLQALRERLGPQLTEYTPSRPPGNGTRETG